MDNKIMHGIKQLMTTDVIHVIHVWSCVHMHPFKLWPHTGMYICKLLAYKLLVIYGFEGVHSYIPV